MSTASDGRQNIPKPILRPALRGTAALNAAKAACHRGHLFDEANTRVRPNESRSCRACHREAEAARMERVIEARPREAPRTRRQRAAAKEKARRWGEAVDRGDSQTALQALAAELWPPKPMPPFVGPWDTGKEPG